ncbi:plastocyanin/azurin family copper-binding protein [Akkermansiaceae bacterium]|nr:plastocyanin/azurin family copper-binding protein [Akkermansiaceae bacterium]
MVNKKLMTLSSLTLGLPVALSLMPSAYAQKKKVDMEQVWATQNIEVPANPVARKLAIPGQPPAALEMSKDMHIAFIGGGLGSRMNLYSEFETELQRRYPELNLYIRNMCFEGNTPAFRPHPSRNSHVVVPGAETFIPAEYQVKASTKGHYEMPDQWLTRHKVDTVIGFFGYSESFQGPEGLENYKKELRTFIEHTLKQQYSGKQVQLAIVGPAAFENLSAKLDLPNGEKENKNLELYTKAMAEVCKEEGILFVDAFDSTSKLIASKEQDFTINGHNLTQEAYKSFSPVLASALFGEATAKGDYAITHALVSEKNSLWLMDYKIPNGVHVHGRRFAPYGDKNYPTELRKIRQKTQIRDQAIWANNAGKSLDVAAADAKTTPLVKIETNSDRPVEYKTGKEVAELLQVAEGFKVELFADEKGFPDLQNPSQMAFDNEGRLWVGCMGSYPHYEIGDPKANDKIIILEDTDGDNKADKQITFVDNINIPMGFEITEKGVFVSLGTNLVLFEDTDGDSKADKSTVVLSGFDDHDTHHAISSFCADPSGAFLMGEGIFLHSNVETPYGPVRGTDGGFYRYAPNKMQLERTAQLSIPNPWGIAYDDWGQNFFLYTSGPSFGWMQENAVKPKYGRNLNSTDLLTDNKVRPTSGVEFVSSRHFPDEMQGDALICNNIGFLGCKQHEVIQDPKTGFYNAKYRQDLFVSPSEYQYFRPVDLEFAPDGSLFFIDWSNVLIGHMQHNARDPKRDHVHGRVYRVTYPSRPLVTPVKVAGASIEQLLENLKEPEIRTRYRTRRELRGRDAAEVVEALKSWVSSLDKTAERYEHHVLEALWVSWGINEIDQSLLEQVLESKDFRARAAAVRATRYNADKLPNLKQLMLKAAADESQLVRHEAIVAASWLPTELGNEIVTEVEKLGVNKQFSTQALAVVKADLAGVEYKPTKGHSFARKGIRMRGNKYEIGINCVPEGLKFDFEKFEVKVGLPITLVFNNPDVMAHNLVIVKPGKEEEVAKAAMNMGAEGYAKGFVPESEHIVIATKLLNEDERQTLKFSFDTPGKYTYICSFPGHAQPMRGEIIVK